MSKMVLTFGYRSFVLDAATAVKVLDLLQDAEVYETKYHTNSPTTYHIYEQDNAAVEIKYLPNVLYNLYKLAGKPDNN